MNRAPVQASLAFGLLVASRIVQAAPIDPQSILVSHPDAQGLSRIFEFSRSGTLRQSFLIPPATGGAGALEMDRDGTVQFFNQGRSWTTLTPQSAAGAASYVSHTIAGWSLVGVTYYGGVAIVSMI
jgi:hypothetical protein